MKKRNKVIAFALVCLLVLPLSQCFADSKSYRYFPDVLDSQWYATSVNTLTEGGLLSGYADGTFRPKSNMSVGEFVTVVARCVGEAQGAGDTGYWCGATIKHALEEGWLPTAWQGKPVDAKTYGQPITRELAISILMRGLLPEDLALGYTADDIWDYQSIDMALGSDILAAYNAGITKGTSDSAFSPKDRLSRGQAAAILYRAGFVTAQDVEEKVTQTPSPALLTVTLQAGDAWESNGDTYGKYKITIANGSDRAVADWKVTLAGEKEAVVSQAWNGNMEKNGKTIVVTPVAYNTSISAGGEVAGIGMILTNPQGMRANTLVVTYADGTVTTIDCTTQTASTEVVVPQVSATADPVGALRVSGTNLVDADGNVVQLKGLSTHGLAWYPEYVSADTFRSLRDDWGANVIRLALYTEEYGGYCNGGDREKLKLKIDEGVKYATELGMYVIIDWHILSDGNPNENKGEALAFFKEMSKKYADHDNVLYEICNEPTNSPWATVIKPYAEELVSAIREQDKDAVILVGTNTWSQDIDEVVGNQLADKNVMYTFHFYASTHGEALRQKVLTAVKGGVPVFVSECNICDASGSGGIDYASADAWLKLLNENNISFVAWNLSNKGETSALFKTAALSNWTEGDLTDTGKWFKSAIGGK